MNLQDKRVVVTGANGALGRAVVARARALGAEVVQLDIAFPTDAGADCHIVDLADAGVGMRRTHEHRVVHIGQHDVVGVLASAS